MTASGLPAVLIKLGMSVVSSALIDETVDVVESTEPFLSSSLLLSMREAMVEARPGEGAPKDVDLTECSEWLWVSFGRGERGESGGLSREGRVSKSLPGCLKDQNNM